MIYGAIIISLYIPPDKFPRPHGVEFTRKDSMKSEDFFLSTKVCEVEPLRASHETIDGRNPTAVDIYIYVYLKIDIYELTLPSYLCYRVPNGAGFLPSTKKKSTL